MKIGPYEIRKRSFLQPLTLGILRRLEYFRRMMKDMPEGVIVECGVGRGKTLQLLALANELDGHHRTILGFDTFRGFPAPGPEDAGSRNPKEGEWAVSMREIYEVFNHNGVTRPQLIAGFGEILSPVALLHLDLDLYQSYKDALQQFYPKVARGGRVLLDEYSDPKWPGATKAIDEYGLSPSLDPFGKYFCVKA